MNIPILKFGKIKRNHSNYVHCYNCKKAMGDTPFNCINDSWFVTTWKRERDVLIEEEISFNDTKIIGIATLLEVMHYYPYGLPTHVIGYYINDIFPVAHFTYCELAKNLFKAAWNEKSMVTQSF